MTVFGRILCLSTSVIVVCVGTLLLRNAFVSGTSECPIYDFPCDNGECIDAGSWCDSYKDCLDGSDEKYCEKSTFYNHDPNKCPSTYFKCQNGPCIPMIGRCDDFDNCGDSSDERSCNNAFSYHLKPVTSPSGTTAHTAATEATISNGIHFSASSDAMHELRPSEYSHQQEKARNYLISQRRSDFGWGDETPRALTALYLSDMQQSMRITKSDLLMVKQLELLLSLDVGRNGTKAMKLTNLALHLNALLASCKDPNNFYGDNLVLTLRNAVDVAQTKNIFVNPSVYLTLCLNNATTEDDTKKLSDIFFSTTAVIGRMDIQALALLSTTCIFRNTNLLNTTVYDGLTEKFLQRMNVSGVPGNVYEASLLTQALQQLKINTSDLLDFILKQQQEDGSFGGILATYQVLPVLAGRSFLKLNDHCNQRYTTDPAPIEVLKNSKHRKLNVRCTLFYGNPPEITQTIQMQVAEGINFLNVMRLAQEVNPKYRFMLDGNREVPVVYSIDGIPNDAEKGMFWTLYLTSNSSSVEGEVRRLSPYTGNIKQLIAHAGDEFVFWMKSI